MMMGEETKRLAVRRICWCVTSPALEQALIVFFSYRLRSSQPFSLFVAEIRFVLFCYGLLLSPVG